MLGLTLHFGGCIMWDTAYVLSLGEGFDDLAESERDTFIVGRAVADEVALQAVFSDDQVVMQNSSLRG